MNVVKIHPVKVIAGIVLLFSFSMQLHAQELKIGVVNIPALKDLPDMRLTERKERPLSILSSRMKIL